MAARLSTIWILVLVSLAPTAPAHAAFPGANGKIAFENGNIYTVNPDGTGQTQVTEDITPDERPAWSPDGVKLAFDNFVRQNCPGGDQEIFTVNADGTNRTRIDNNCARDEFPAWSPEGTKIVFSRACGSGCPFETYTMNTDGTNQARVTSTPTSDTEPAWSPDGTRIAFARTSCAPSCSNDVYVMNADGTNQTNLTNNMVSDSDPAWSPSGTKIAFTSHRDGNDEIYVMNAGGTNQTRLTSNVASDVDPAWSPDGTKIAFTSNRDGNDEIYVINADGTSPTRLTNSTASDREPDWQPIPYTGYPRPRGAAPMRVSLVPAYEQCNSPNSTHGAPLGYPSCHPPVQTSGHLTLGTPDANGAAANSTGFISLRVKAASPEDVLIDSTITDVRCQAATSATVCDNANSVGGLDYSGEIQLKPTLRITDHYNGSGLNETATGTDVPFPVNGTCAKTVPTMLGGTCNVSTTANAVVPGFVRDGKRAVVEVARVQVFDGGADGVVSTADDNTLFMDQGIFVP